MNYEKEFNGIWVCASLLHIPYSELDNVLLRCYKSLKDNGVMYMSFKYSDFEGIRNGRYFTDLNEERLMSLLVGKLFKIKELLTTSHVRPDRNDKWLNAILIKK